MNTETLKRWWDERTSIQKTFIVFAGVVAVAALGQAAITSIF